MDKGKFADGYFVYRQVRRLETAVCRQADHVVTICGGLREDLEFATQPRFCYSHEWRDPHHHHPLKLLESCFGRLLVAL